METIIQTNIYLFDYLGDQDLLKDFGMWLPALNQLPKNMLSRRGNEGYKTGTGNGCPDRRLLTQLLIQIEMNQGGGDTGGESWRESATTIMLAH